MPQGVSETASTASVLFIENVGQFPSPADFPEEGRPRFQVRGTDGVIYLAPNAIWITLLQPITPTTALEQEPVAGTTDQAIPSPEATPVPPENQPRPLVHLRLSFAGANPRPRIVGIDPQKVNVAYFMGNDPQQWYSRVPVFGSVRYEELYPGIDLEITSRNGTWSWRLYLRNIGVTPIDQVANVRLQTRGSDGLTITDNGKTIGLANGIRLLTLPLLDVAGDAIGTGLEAWIAIGSPRPSLEGDDVARPFAVPTGARATSESHGAGLQSPALPANAARRQRHDGDMNQIIFSTTIGGNSVDNSQGIIVDASKNAYITGNTSSNNLPTTIGPGYGGGFSDIFVAKVNGSGAMQYLTYLGGDASDFSYGIAVDTAGRVYVTGDTDSGNFPVPNGYSACTAGTIYAIVSKLDSSGGLVYSTCLGPGSGSDIGVKPGSSDETVYVVGQTNSDTFPTAGNPYQSSRAGGFDAFISRLNTAVAGTGSLVYSTFYGGSGDDCEVPFRWAECGMDVDSSGRVFIAGPTKSDGLPALNYGAPFSNSRVGSTIDIMVARHSTVAGGTGGSKLLTAAYLGGNGDDCLHTCAIAIGGNLTLYIVGQTTSTNLPNHVGDGYKNNTDTFVAKASYGPLWPYEAQGFFLNWTTYHGGDNIDEGKAIDISANGDIAIVGDTASSHTGTNAFPTTVGAFDTTYAGGTCSSVPCRDVFLATFSPEGGRLYSSYVGGNAQDYGFGLGLCPGTCRVYFTGVTTSSDYPRTSGPVPGNESYVTVLKLPTSASSRNWSGGGSGGEGGPGQQPGDDRECDCWGGQSAQAYTPYPINTSTGAFSYSMVDLSVPTSAGTLAFQRTYASPTINVYSTTLGYGWTHNQDTRLILPEDPLGEYGTVWFKAHTANQYQFTIDVTNGITTYVPYPGVLASLVYTTTPTDTYTLITPQQATYIFDGGGQLTQWRDAENHQFNYSYDLSSGRLITVTEPLSTRYLALTYDGQGRIQSVSDHSGRQVTYGYGLTSGDLITVTDILGQNWTFSYSTTISSTHLLADVKDPNDSATATLHTDYDTQGRAWRQYDGAGNLHVQITYNTDGATTVMDGRGFTETHRYDGANTLVGEVGQLGSAITKTYDANFRPAVITDSLNAPTTLTWSATGANLTQVNNALSQSTSFTYDPLNNLTRTVDARGFATTMTYTDTLLATSTDALNNQTLYTYTTAADAPQPVNLLKAMTDPRGNTTQYQYDALGQRTVITDALGIVTTYGYDNLGRVITTTVATGRPEQQITVNQYDNAGRLTKATRNYLAGQAQNYQNTYNLVTQYGYDAVGNQTVMTDTLGQVTRNEYDNANRLIKTTSNYLAGQGQNYQNQYNLITTYQYNEIGLQVLMTDTLGLVNRTEYDALNRPVTVTVNYKDGNFDSNKPFEDVQTVTQYDSNGNVTATLQAANTSLVRTTRTQYDVLNRPVTVTVNYVNGVFDAAKPDEDIQSFTGYDANGNVVTSTQYVNVSGLARTTRTEYDALNRPVTVTVNYVDGTFSTAEPDKDIRTVTEYDANGNVRFTTQFFGLSGLERRTLTEYDALNRPVTVTVNYVDGTFNAAESDRDIRSVTVYDALGRVTTTTRFAGTSLARTMKTEYDVLGRPITTTANFVDGSFSASEPDRDIRSLSQYDAGGNVISTTQFANVTGLARTSFTQYDSAYRPITQTTNYTGAAFNPNQPDRNIVSSVAYDALGNRLSQTEVRGGPGLTTTNITTTFQYDSLYRVITTTIPLTGTAVASMTVSFDALGRVEYSIDPLGKRIRTQYDQLDRPITVTVNYVNGVFDAAKPDEDLSTVYTYDAAGNRTQMRDPKGIVTKYEYDLLNRLTAVVENYISGGSTNNETNVRTEYTYDAAGNRKTIKDGRNKTTAFTFDLLNRQLTMTDPLSNTWAYAYDAAGNTITMTDALARATVTTYDLFNRPTKIDYPSPDPDVLFTYDGAGQRTVMTDSVGTTTWNYDLLSRPITITQPFTGSVAYTYDSAGNRLALAYPDGKAVTSTYDLASRLVQVRDWAASLTRYSYDTGSRLTTVALPNGITSTYGYDGADRLTVLQHQSATQAVGVYTYTFDALGNRTAVTETVRSPSLSDDFNRADSTSLGSNWTERVGDFAIVSQTLRNDSTEQDHLATYTGTYTDVTVSARVQLTGSSGTTALGARWGAYSDGLPGQGYMVDMDDLGHLNLWRVDDFSSALGYYEIPGYSSGQWVALGLKATGTQLVVTVSGSPVITATDSAFTEGEAGLWSYTPGGAGAHRFDDFTVTPANPTPATQAINYMYDPLSRLTTASYNTGLVFTYTYDSVGNRLSQTITNTTVYTYDDANRLTNAGGVAYTWNANGNLINDGVYTYTYDTVNRLSNVTGAGLTASYAYNGMGARMRQVTGGITTTYTLDLNAGLTQVLANSSANTYLYGNGRIAQFAGATPQYFLADHLGSVRQLTNAGGAVTLAKGYQPYGTVLSSSGTAASSYGFTGEQTDNTGLVYLRARYLSTSTGRFISKDKWSGNNHRPQSLNAWQYVEGNPINVTDPTGKFPDWCRSGHTPWHFVYCVLSYYGLDSIDNAPGTPPSPDDYVQGAPGCWIGPVHYRGKGYVEGYQLGGSAFIGGSRGQDLVYDFATMERHLFNVTSGFLTDPISVFAVAYAGEAEGFRTDTNVAADYGGWSFYGQLGLAGELPIGGGIAIGVASWESFSDPAIEGLNEYVSLSIGADPIIIADIAVGVVLAESSGPFIESYVQADGKVDRGRLHRDITEGRYPNWFVPVQGDLRMAAANLALHYADIFEATLGGQR
jgi:RHS repeat-associated protein